VSQWSTALGLYAHDLRYSKVSPQIDNLYGAQLMKAGRMDEAKFFLERSVALNPSIGNNLENLGVWHELRGEDAAAKVLYQRDIDLDNRLSKSYAYAEIVNITLYGEKNPSEAVRICKFALEKYPTDQKLLALLPVAEYLAGDKEAAVAAAKHLAEIYPTEENQATYAKYVNAAKVK
jgi:Flp pilus assembly protein TadD